MPFRTPTKDIQFALEHIAGLNDVLDTGAFPDTSWDLVEAVIEEAGKLTSEVIAPLNRSSDEQGARFENGVVTMPVGFKEAFQKVSEGGWLSLPFGPTYGGQGLPGTLGVTVMEMINSASINFGLTAILGTGAAELLAEHADESQKQTYMTKIISGEWTGTMNLTEPQAGSDVGLVKTKAVKQDDGTYRIFGTKIFITSGEHDMTDNIIHLVLARTPDAPDGVKGISLFIVPKVLLNENGIPDKRNDVNCAGIEHKMGINGSPTCVMKYGEEDGAVGYLVGRENDGLKYMFTMMNNARLNVGMQGVGVAEHAYQHALNYAKDRKQGKGLLATAKDNPTAIINHPDVRRMLLSMKSMTEASRAICYANAVAIDLAKNHPDEAERNRAKMREELLTPLSKGWSTDIAQEVTSLGVQIHGGMGFVEETGAAQFMRDARILPIYEGTNGIQAADLVGRKLGMMNGGVMREFLDEIAVFIDHLDGEKLAAIRESLVNALEMAEEATDWILENGGQNPLNSLAASKPYLDLMGTLAGGYYLAKGAVAALRLLSEGASDKEYLASKIAVADFFAKNILPRVHGYKPMVCAGYETLYAIDDDWLAPS